jgi:hypothetical protein
MDSYNRNYIWWEKNKKDKDYYSHWKNIHTLKICGILKFEKFKELSKIDQNF